MLGGAPIHISACLLLEKASHILDIGYMVKNYVMVNTNVQYILAIMPSDIVPTAGWSRFPYSKKYRI